MALLKPGLDHTDPVVPAVLSRSVTPSDVQISWSVHCEEECDETGFVFWTGIPVASWECSVSMLLFGLFVFNLLFSRYLIMKNCGVHFGQLPTHYVNVFLSALTQSLLQVSQPVPWFYSSWIASAGPVLGSWPSAWQGQSAPSMQEETFRSYDAHLSFSEMEKQAVAAAVPCEWVCHEPAGQGIVRGIISLGGWHWPWPSGMVTKDFLFSI